MRMSFRRMASLLLAVMVMVGCVPAMAEMYFEGKVISCEKVAVSAPFGGLVEHVALRAGQPVALGDPVATLGTTKVYAALDGTVSGVFAREGDDTEDIVTRYGAVVYIEPTNRYVVSASTEKAYNSSAAKYIHIGEKVYLSCTMDGTHTGTAIVTQVGETDAAGNTTYTLEVTGGELYMGETVGIFRAADYAAESRIGRGTVGQNPAVGVKGSGSVLKMHVQPGDKVERGEVLFETVTGALDGLFAVDNTIVSGVSGVVASVDVEPGNGVEKNARLITVHPDGSFRVEVLVSEMELNDIAEGDKVAIEFNWDVDGQLRLDGVVESISMVNEQAEGDDAEVKYSAYIRFTPTDEVRLGMSVIVYMVEDELPDEVELAGEAVVVSDEGSTEE